MLILAYSCISNNVLVLLFWSYESHCWPTMLWLCAGPPVLNQHVGKTKHTWFPTQKNTSKTYITDSRNVLPSCARGKVNRFYHSHKNLSLELPPWHHSSSASLIGDEGTDKTYFIYLLWYLSSLPNITCHPFWNILSPNHVFYRLRLSIDRSNEQLT